jgi:hypothetical protein
MHRHSGARRHVQAVYGEQDRFRVVKTCLIAYIKQAEVSSLAYRYKVRFIIKIIPNLR